MNATEELRRLLDERGVGYSREGCETFFKNIHIWAINNKKLCISISGLTPAQVIDATLGRRTTTRHGKFRTKYGRSVPVCECCGYGIGDERWHYCPSCGAEVVGE